MERDPFPSSLTWLLVGFSASRASEWWPQFLTVCCLEVTPSSLSYVSLHRMSHNVEACFIRASKEKVEGGGWQWESHYFITKSWTWRAISFIRDKSWGLVLSQGKGFLQGTNTQKWKSSGLTLEAIYYVVLLPQVRGFWMCPYGSPMPCHLFMLGPFGNRPCMNCLIFYVPSASDSYRSNPKSEGTYWNPVLLHKEILHEVRSGKLYVRCAEWDCGGRLKEKWWD